MHIAGNNFAKSKYNAFHIVSVFYISNATNLASIVEVKQYKGVCLGVNKKIPSRDILVDDAVLDI